MSLGFAAAFLNFQTQVPISIEDDKDKNGTSELYRLTVDFIAGCMGGCAALIVGHPLDTVKVHLQTQDTVIPKYRGTLHCFVSIWKEDKLHGLYSGMASPMAGVSFINAIVFGIYGYVQRSMTDPDSLHSHLIAGGVSGLFQSWICSPIELAKTRMQLQHEHDTGIKHKGSLDCLRHIIRTEGFKGTFRGLAITALRDVPAYGAYFVSYESLMRIPETPTAMHAFFAGGVAGMFCWLASYPQDVVKTCLQAEGFTEKPKYNGIIDCVVKGYKADGLHFFFRGFTATMIRSFPANAACFFVVAAILRFAHSDKIDLIYKKHN